MRKPPSHSPSGQNIDPHVQQDVNVLEKKEEKRKQNQESDESTMSDDQYRESLRDEFGTGRWADKVVDEMAKKRNATSSSRAKQPKGSKQGEE